MWLGSVNQKSLREIDTHHVQFRQDVLSINELSDGLHAHDLGDLCKAPDSDFVQRIRDQITNELAIDLQEIDRHVFQVAEGGSTSTEIIQRHTHTYSAYLRNKQRGIREIRHRRRFGDLETQFAANFPTCRGEYLDCPAVKDAIADRLSRQIHT